MIRPHRPAWYLRQVVLHCLLPLLAGGLVYLLFRPGPYRLTQVQTGRHLHGRGWTMLADTLPDFCWSYSLAMALYLYTLYFRRPRRLMAVAVLFLLLGAEAVQLFFPARFTFDGYDLIAAFLAFLLSTYVYNKIRRHEKEHF